MVSAAPKPNIEKDQVIYFLKEDKNQQNNRRKNLEQNYIEERLTLFENYKKLKIIEQDVTSFEDGVITFNAAQLFLDFLVYSNNFEMQEQEDSKTLFLPVSILKKFNQNQEKACQKINDLTNGKMINQYDTIMTLHEDRYSKKEYSLIFIHNLSSIENPDSKQQAEIIIYKSRDYFSDSEIDSIIDLRKMLAYLTGFQLSNENLPSKTQVTHFNSGGLREAPETLKDQLRIDSQLGQISVYKQLINKPSDEQSNLYQVNFNQSFYNTLQGEMRDLFYMLYDYQYFENYNIQNESSIFVSRRAAACAQNDLSSSTESQILEESQYDQEIDNSLERQVEQSDENNQDKQKLENSDNSELIIIEQRTRRSSFENKRDSHQRKLSVIEEEPNESVGMSFEMKRGNREDGRVFELDYQNISRSFIGSQINASVIVYSPNRIEEKSMDEIDLNSFDVIKLQNCQLNQANYSIDSEERSPINQQPPQQVYSAPISSVQISLPIKRRSIHISPQVIECNNFQILESQPEHILAVQTKHAYFYCNQWPSATLKHTYQLQMEVKVEIVQESSNNQIRLMKNRSLSKKYLLGNQFQQKSHRLKKQSANTQNTQSAPRLRELEKSILNMPRQMNQDLLQKNLNQMILSVLSNEQVEDNQPTDVQNNLTFDVNFNRLNRLNANQIRHQKNQPSQYSAKSKKVNQSLIDLPEISCNESNFNNIEIIDEEGYEHKYQESQSEISAFKNNQRNKNIQILDSQKQFLIMTPPDQINNYDMNNQHFIPGVCGDFQNYLDTDLNQISDKKDIRPSTIICEDSQGQSLLMILSPSFEQPQLQSNMQENMPPHVSILESQSMQPLSEKSNFNNQFIESVTSNHPKHSQGKSEPSKFKNQSKQSSSKKQSSNVTNIIYDQAAIHHFEPVLTSSSRNKERTPSSMTLIDQDRKEKILQSVKSGKFTIRCKKTLQSGRMKYKHVNSIITDVNISDLKSSLISAGQRDGINNQQSVNISNISCKHCYGSNWNQKYNMPCSNCVEPPMLSSRKIDKHLKRKNKKDINSSVISGSSNFDFPRQIN